MATNRFLLGILCLVITYGNGLFGSGSLEKVSRLGVREEFSRLAVGSKRWLVGESVRRADMELLRCKVVELAQSQVGVREFGNNNHGKAVEAYLAYTKMKPGNPWCAAFVSWVYGQQGRAQPKTAWSPNLFPLARQTLKPLPADVFGIYFPDLGRIAHCGLVERKKGNWIYSIEGNTNVTGSREGDGVYRKLRHSKTIKVYADWVNELGNGLGQLKLSKQGSLLKMNNTLQAVGSLPRGQQTFPLMEKYAKDKVRNEASTLKAITWPAVPACPTLLGTVFCGELYEFRESKHKSAKIDGEKSCETLLKSLHCQVCLNKLGKEGLR
ncbi:hypothetical protein [Pedobacter frigiditerrae]|uniref:hypothetical protein n=1 Tax=Pedobacter frigiditerrae TaxID=2530452 RepID=UPI0029308EC4|nr:hypothetical protein [Pedobacter frigiditerrae]